MRRLTHSQYNHTVRDLLGDQTAPAMQFPPADFVNGFLKSSQLEFHCPTLPVQSGFAGSWKVASELKEQGST